MAEVRGGVQAYFFDIRRELGEDAGDEGGCGAFAFGAREVDGVQCVEN